jgi:hypothetical protein
MLGIILVVIALLAAAAPTTHAQGHPDLSGTWKLNLDKSDYGDLQGPETRIDVIEQNDGHVSERVTAEGRHRKQQYTLLFATDGSETALPSETKMGSVTILSVSANWQGETLVVTQKLRFQDASLMATNAYQLAGDGKTLTIALTLGSDRVPAATFVFDRILTAEMDGAGQMLVKASQGPFSETDAEDVHKQPHIIVDPVHPHRQRLCRDLILGTVFQHA